MNQAINKVKTEAELRQESFDQMDVSASFDGEVQTHDALDIAPDSKDVTQQPSNKSHGYDVTANNTGDRDDTQGDETTIKVDQSPAQPKKKSAADRIPELLADRKAEKERADKLEARLKALEDGGTITPPDPASAQISNDQEVKPLSAEDITAKAVERIGERPTEEQFNSFDEYNDALTDWKVDVRLAEARLRDDDKKRIAGIQQAEVAFSQKLHEGDDKWADYAELMQSPTTGFTHAMVAAMQDCELVSDIAYYLAKDPQEMARIARMQPIAMAREIGKIEQRFLSDPTSRPQGPPPDSQAVKKEPEATVIHKADTPGDTAQTKTVSQAPEPIEPEGHAATHAAFDPEKASPEEYRKWREGGGGKR